MGSNCFHFSLIWLMSTGKLFVALVFNASVYEFVHVYFHVTLRMMRDILSIKSLEFTKLNFTRLVTHVIVVNHYMLDHIHMNQQIKIHEKCLRQSGRSSSFI